MPDPIRIRSGSAGRHGPETGPHDSCTPARFRTGSLWPKPGTVSQNSIGSGLVLYNIIREVCGRTEPSLKVGNWWRAVCVLPETGPDDSCTPACFRTGSVWPKPGTVSQNSIGSGLVLYNIIREVCGRTEPSLKVGNWWRAVCVLPETGPDDSCTPACFQTRGV